MLSPRLTLFPVSMSMALEGLTPKMPSSSATVTDMRADGARSGDSSVRPPWAMPEKRTSSSQKSVHLYDT